MIALDIRPLSPVLGAEIGNIDLAAGIDRATFDAVHQAFLQHGVLFFRNQSPLAAEDHVAFARRFGPPHTHPAAPPSDQGDAAGSAIFVIHTHRHSPIANGNGWHSDVSCQPKPPMATVLQIHQLPAGGGGDTLFASTEAAYAALTAAQRRRIRSLRARHESEHVYRGRYADRGVDDAGVDYPWAEHPVVRTHPETGRQGIYVNRSFTTGIVGMNRDASDELLRWLFWHTERPEFQIRFSWQVNDVALWDNRCLLHYAVWDYWPKERRGHRVSVEGDVPFFAGDGPEPPPSRLRLSSGALIGGENSGSRRRRS